MGQRSAEFRRTLSTLKTAGGALLSLVPFAGHLLLAPFTGRGFRRRVRRLLREAPEPAVDEPPEIPPAGEAPGSAGARSVYVIAGEDSGDLHASNLVRALRRRDPGLRIRGMGGPRMAEAGCRLDHDLVRMNVMGVWPVLRAVGTFFGLYRKLLRNLETDPPDVLVPVDYPGFNLRVARAARRRGIPVVYYIAPQVWAWAPWRLGKVARAVDLLLVILPFERDLFREAGTRCAFVGHPLTEHLARETPSRPGEEGPRIGLLPGSRRSEVGGLLPGMLRTARRVARVHPEVRFVLPYRGAPLRPVIDRVLRGEGRGLDVEVVEGRTHETMRGLSAALVASGTATLELAWYRVPMVVLYRIGWAAALLRRLLLIVPHVALVNIVAGRRVVPEYVRVRDPSGPAAEALLAWLEDPGSRARCREDLDRVRSRLLFTGVADRAAGFVLATAATPRGRRRASP